jgi:arylsulfatase A-like enzyme
MGITRPPQRYLGASDDIEFPRVPSLNEADVSDKPRTLQETPLTDEHISCFEEMFHARLESMLAVDDMIGSIVTALDQNNEDNTILIFTSDNGYLLGEHRLHGKQYVYEESIRLPLYVRIPGVSQNTIDKLVINNDLAPTLLEYAKAKPSAGFKIDGRSLVPLIQDPTIQWRNGFLIEDNLYNAIRTEDYVYAVRHTGDKEVYDLISDPYQLENLAGRSSWESKIDALDEWRIALAECSGEDCKILEDRSAP